jgi:hypothetical protein
VPRSAQSPRVRGAFYFRRVPNLGLTSFPTIPHVSSLFQPSHCCAPPRRMTAATAPTSRRSCGRSWRATSRPVRSDPPHNLCWAAKGRGAPALFCFFATAGLTLTAARRPPGRRLLPRSLSPGQTCTRSSAASRTTSSTRSQGRASTLTSSAPTSRRRTGPCRPQSRRGARPRASLRSLTVSSPQLIAPLQHSRPPDRVLERHELSVSWDAPSLAFRARARAPAMTPLTGLSVPLPTRLTQLPRRAHSSAPTRLAASSSCTASASRT